MRKSIRPQSRRHIWFYDETWEFIVKILAPRAKMSPGSYCREVLYRVVQAKQEEIQQAVEEAGRSTDK